jgi:hypothetical protein
MKKEAEAMKYVPYRQVLGKLVYAMGQTRPDIIFAVEILGRVGHDPRTRHWAAMKKLMRYLRGTSRKSLYINKREESNQKADETVLQGYVDTDWAGDVGSRKSTSGYAFFLGTTLISWSSKKQQTVALSTAEAEYMALTEAIKQGIWLNN